LLLKEKNNFWLIPGQLLAIPVKRKNALRAEIKQIKNKLFKYIHDNSRPFTAIHVLKIKDFRKILSEATKQHH